MADHMHPPKGYIWLQDAINKPIGQSYDVIGICVDALEPTRSGGSDYTIKFALSDASWVVDRGMQFRFFHKSLESLPALRNTGDVVILKNVATKKFGQSLLGLSNYATSWVVLSGSNVADSVCPLGSDIKVVSSRDDKSMTKLNIQELQYVKTLISHTDPSSFRMPSKATALQIAGIMKDNGGTPPPRKGKFRLLKDLKLDKSNSSRFSDGQPAFAEFVGEVRKIYTGDHRSVEVYFTDYTAQPELYNYSVDPVSRDGDQFGYTERGDRWVGPWGKMTIRVLLWDAHATYARSHITPGTFVALRNCHVKYDPHGSQLEAACRGDRDDASKVNISIIEPHEAKTNDVFKDFLHRRKDYVKLAEERGLPMTSTTNMFDKKRSLTAFAEKYTGETKQEKPATMTKAQRKKMRKKAKQHATAAIGPEQSQSTTLGNFPNQNVRCKNVEIPVTTIDDILDCEILRRKSPAGNEYSLPFQNCAYRCRVKVVDYWPNDIADFASPYRKSLHEDVSGDDKDLDEMRAGADSDLIGWEWRFALIVEDAGPRPTLSHGRRKMPLIVANDHAVHLLREDACNLRANPLTLAKIREKLFILWGDLQEQKDEAKSRRDFETAEIQSKSFECFIEEYGLPLSERTPSHDQHVEYQRTFQIADITV